MEVTIIRLSRPLLLANDKYKDDYTYQTIYGFIIRQPIQDVNLNRVEEYVGYLAGLHRVFSGSDDFTITWEARGVPDWKDKKGHTHLKYDDWMEKIFKKSIKKLDLSYTIIPLNLDEEAIILYTNQDMLITDESFYWSLEGVSAEESESEKPLWDEDDLPF